MWFRQIAIAVFLSGLVASVQAASSISVDQRGLVFSQRTAILAPGDRLVFTNSDDVIHNIHIMTQSDEVERNLGLQKPGAALFYVFASAGTYLVRCNIHPGMKIQVTVK
jgi:plastocyanin